MTLDVNIHVNCNRGHFMTNTASTTLHHLDTDTLPLPSISWTVFNVHICHWETSLSCQTSSHTQDKLSDFPLRPPHLPPIRPLEQTRWVRGRVAHSSLRIAEVLVVTAESVGRFGQAEGAHRPGRGWHCPKGSNFSGTRLTMSHLGFQMKGLFKRQGPFDCLLTVLLLLVLSNCVLQAQRDNWALAIPPDMQL